MGHAVYFVTPVICVILIRHFVRQPAGSFFVEGLLTYLFSNSAIPQPGPGAKVSKRERKLLQKRQIAVKGAQSSQLIAQQISPGALIKLGQEPSTFAEAFELIGILLLVLVVGLVVHVTLGPLLGVWQDVLLWSLGPVVIVMAALQLLLLEGNGQLSRLLGHKWHVPLVGAMTATAAYAALVLAAPLGWLPWDLAAVGRDFDALVNGAVRFILALRMKELQPPPPISTDPNLVAAVLAGFVGLIGASLLGACARAARLYSYISPVPHWAEKHLAPGAAALAAIRLSFVLPLLVVLYGIPPVAAAWGALLRPLAHPALLRPEVLAAVGPALLAAAALAQLLAVRPLVAAHLGSGLLEFHLLRHEGRNDPTKEALMRKRLTYVYATVCHAALQLLAPAAMLFCLALMYGAATGVLDPFWPPQPLLYDMNAIHAAPSSAARAPAPAPAPVSSPAPTPVTSAHDALEGLDLDDAAADVAAAAAAAASAAAAGAQAAAAAAASAVGAAVTAAANATAAAVGGLPALPPLDFLRFATGFVSWWVCALTCLFLYPMLFVYRTGLHVG